MERFTKTTEIENSDEYVNDEKATLRKKKFGKLLAIIICLILAIVAWIYVVETDETKVEKKFDDVSVTILDKSDKFNIYADKVSVTLIGTNSQLVDVDPSKIVVTVSGLEHQDKYGERYCVESISISYEGEEEVEIKEKSVDVWITLEEKSGK